MSGLARDGVLAGRRAPASMGACISSIQRMFRKPVQQEEYIYLPARSPKRSFHMPNAVTTAVPAVAAPPSEQPARVSDAAAPAEREVPPPLAAPVPVVDPAVLRRQHDELIQKQSSFIHLKLSVETLVRENRALGADDGV